MSLGRCDKCHGDLCLSGRVVTCERCGQPLPDHPVTRANHEAAATTVTPSPVTPPQEYAVTWLDRIAALEKRGEALCARVAALEGEAVTTTDASPRKPPRGGSSTAPPRVSKESRE